MTDTPVESIAPAAPAAAAPRKRKPAAKAAARTRAATAKSKTVSARTKAVSAKKAAPEPAKAPVAAARKAKSSVKVEISRESEARRIITKYLGWGAGSGVVPVPVADVAALATVQVLMVRELLHLYEKPFSESRVRTTVTVLLGSLAPSAIGGFAANAILKLVPVIGYPLSALTMPALTTSATYAVGTVIASHLAAGGDLESLKVAQVKSQLQEAYAHSKATAGNVYEQGKVQVGKVFGQGKAVIDKGVAKMKAGAAAAAAA